MQAYKQRIEDWGAEHPALYGICAMVLATFFFAAMHACVRHVSQELHPFEVAFFRNLFGFLVFLPWIVKTGLAALHTTRLGLHGIRAGVNSISMLCWFTALSMIPLADATALGLTGPLFASLAAALILGEKIKSARWIALAIGMVGAIVIVRPGIQEVHTGMILVIAAMASVALSKVMAKILTRTDTPAAIVAWLTLLMTPITFVPALFYWEWPAWEHYLWFVAIGIFGSTAHVLIVTAYRHADVSLVEPVVFIRLIWAAALGYVFFSEVPEIWIWVGGAIIVASTTYLAKQSRNSTS